MHKTIGLRMKADDIEFSRPTAAVQPSNFYIFANDEAVPLKVFSN